MPPLNNVNNDVLLHFFLFPSLSWKDVVPIKNQLGVYLELLTPPPLTGVQLNVNTMSCVVSLAEASVRGAGVLVRECGSRLEGQV